MTAFWFDCTFAPFTHTELPTVDQYRYQFGYIKERCSYMTKGDLALIHGENARKVYGL